MDLSIVVATMGALAMGYAAAALADCIGPGHVLRDPEVAALELVSDQVLESELERWLPVSTLFRDNGRQYRFYTATSDGLTLILEVQ